MSDSQIFPRGTAGLHDGIWRRFLAALVDAIVLATLLWAFLSVAGVAAVALAGLDAAPYANAPHDAAGLMAESAALAALAVAMLVLLYKVGFEASALQATPGKMALGIRVAGGGGGRLSVGAATLRAWPWWAPALLLAADALLDTDGLFSGASGLTALVSFAVAVFAAGNHAVHDMMAGALVAGKAARFGSSAATA